MNTTSETRTFNDELRVTCSIEQTLTVEFEIVHDEHHRKPQLTFGQARALVADLSNITEDMANDNCGNAASTWPNGFGFDYSEDTPDHVEFSTSEFDDEPRVNIYLSADQTNDMCAFISAYVAKTSTA